MCDIDEAAIINLQRAVVAAKLQKDPKSPVVAQTTDTLLRLLPVLAHLPVDWTGTLQIPFRPGVMGRIEKLVPVSWEEGLDKP
jgi:hypothetical protein